MPNCIFLHLETSENRSATFKFREPFISDFPPPIELANISKIAVGFKPLGSKLDDTKYKVFDINDYVDVVVSDAGDTTYTPNEFKMLSEFYSFFIKLQEQAKIKDDNFLIGYDIKKYILPSLLKLIITKHDITTYDKLPNFIKTKHLKPWDESRLIDIKDESSFGGNPVPFDYFKFFYSFVGTGVLDDLKFIIEKSKL